MCWPFFHDVQLHNIFHSTKGDNVFLFGMPPLCLQALDLQEIFCQLFHVKPLLLLQSVQMIWMFGQCGTMILNVLFCLSTCSLQCKACKSGLLMTISSLTIIHMGRVHFTRISICFGWMFPFCIEWLDFSASLQTTFCWTMWVIACKVCSINCHLVSCVTMVIDSPKKKNEEQQDVNWKEICAILLMWESNSSTSGCFWLLHDCGCWGSFELLFKKKNIKAVFLDNSNC